ncbi:MAG: hypothetical protein J0H06_11925 [Actinobacteria bacterium]|nr:hypothetical protein [Actinomycetota bacterium]OJU86090.1 MAG: hypothetical protein BGO11_04725 [Solirubrobacterales bacterium 70-9]
MSLLLLAVVGALVVAGCGGGGGSSSSSSPSSASGGGEASSGDFASTAEAACATANKEIEALGTPGQAQVLKYLETTEAVIEELHEQVQAAGGEGSAEAAYTEGLNTAVPVLNKMANAARNENFDAVRELSDELIQIHLGELAEAAELKTCAEVPGGPA